MINLLRAELYKLKRNKPFWVIVATTIGLSLLLHALIITDWWMMNNVEFAKAGISELNALPTFTVPLFFNLIVSSLAGFFISVEFTNSGVIKNQMLSGNKRSHIFIAKYLIFSLGSIILLILIPLITAIILVFLFGQGDIFHSSSIMYLARAYGLFTLQFLGYTAIIMLLAIVTEDSGKTIIFSILFTIVMFAVEKLAKPPVLELAYEHSIFQQFSAVFRYSMTSGEMITAIIIGVMTTIIITLCGVLIFNRKEIK